MSNHENESMAPTPGEKLTNFFKRRDVIIASAVGIAVTALTVIIGGWWYTKWMPTSLSTDMRSIERLMVIFTWISAPVCGAVVSITLYTFFNRHKGDTPPEDGPGIRTRGPIVILWSVVSSLLCLVAVVYGLIELNSADGKAQANAPHAMIVEVTGNQWVWNFHYPAQDVTTDKLMLPINQPVEFRITSVDVNHSFWPVQLGVKADANRVQVTLADTTPNKLGHLDVKCAELCGLYHAYMETTGAVMTRTDFNNWVTAQGGHTA
jgi:cytochrome c oxidase subunit 2